MISKRGGSCLSKTQGKRAARASRIDSSAPQKITAELSACGRIAVSLAK
jgi:hypothetical protein